MSNIMIPEDLGSRPFPERLKLLTSLAGEADPERRVFGSRKKDYSYSPAAEPEKVRQFEERNNIRLPEEYVTFLTCVGNGGAGVDQGMFSLEEAEKNNDFDGMLSKGPTLFDREDPEEYYCGLCEETEQLEKKYGEDAAELIDRLTCNITRGMFIIGTAGSTCEYFIMISGKKKGMIGQIDWNFTGRLSDVPRMFDLTLSEWLEDHFMRIIKGSVLSRGSFDSVDYRTDIGTKKRAVPIPREETVPEKKAEAASPAPAPQPAPAPAPVRQSAISPAAAAPQPVPGTAPAPQPVPRPAPPPQPAVPPRKIYRVGDYIVHKKYGGGMITNVVGNIITADYFSCGPKSLVLPYDEKDIEN